MAKRPPLADYIVVPEKDDRETVVFGMRVLYQYEPADWSVGMPEAYFLRAIELNGKWIGAEAFVEDFQDAYADAIGDAVRQEAADDFDIPEAA